MPTLSKILKPTQTIAIPFGDEIVHVTYRPQYMTPEFEESIKSLQDEEKATEAFLSLFCKLVSSWDLKAEEGDEEPIKVTADNLKVIPYDILGEILAKVQEASVPNGRTPENFDDTSRPADGSDQFPNGTP